ncbi:hypothetical protein [Ramlibacter sp.]|uniref:hypothetical protein n=1 Tax=Ramlibacter sp. TaxID=1917967 RepID=UPI003D0F5AE3
MTREAAVSKMFEQAIASSKRRDDWAATVRNFDHAVDGVACNLHFKVQLIWQRTSTAARISGECFVFLSSPGEGDLVGGCGWVHFGVSEAGARGAWRLFEMAFDEAVAELRSKPEFAARSESVALGFACRAATSSPTRPARL